MNKYYLSISFLLLFHYAIGQQLPDRSYFSGMNFLWNPAMTGEAQQWDVFSSYRQQWAGFEGNPKTLSVGAQFPILDYNMGLGGYIIRDEVQPINTTNIGLNYAYHLKLGLFKADVISIGLTGNFSQFVVDPNQIVVNDLGDGLAPIGERSKFTMNGGVGLYYVSHSNAYSQSFSDESFFYFGAAANQIIPFDLMVEGEEANLNNFKRAIHANATIGARVLTDYFFVEPSVWANYSQGNIFNMNLGVTFEIYDLMWAGVAYSTVQATTLQAGYIFQEGLPQYNSIRIGTLATFNTGNFTQPRGLSYEFFIGYRYLL